MMKRNSLAILPFSGFEKLLFIVWRILLSIFDPGILSSSCSSWPVLNAVSTVLADAVRSSFKLLLLLPS